MSTPLPANVGTGIVKGRIVRAVIQENKKTAVVPGVGSATFTASPDRLLDPGASPDTIILPDPITVSLTALGDIGSPDGVELIATDDPDLSPNQWTWTVSFNLQVGQLKSFSFAVPENTVVSLGSVAALPASSGVQIIEVSGIPAGGVTGQVLTKASDADYDIDWETGTGGGGTGREVELQNNGTYLQWRYVGDATWTNLVALADISGTDGADGADGSNGREVQFQTTSTYIQWRYVGDAAWTNLVALASLKGAKGNAGPGVPTGGTIGQVLVKNSAADYDTTWGTPSGGGGGDGTVTSVQHIPPDSTGNVQLTADSVGAASIAQLFGGIVYEEAGGWPAIEGENGAILIGWTKPPIGPGFANSKCIFGLRDAP